MSTTPTIDQLIAERVRELRKQHGHSLETLAQLSGVSRSMISLIERSETSATAAVLGKLAQALQVPLAFLFEEPASSAEPQPLARAAQQQCWQDPATGYVRRHLSPSGYAAPLELVEVVFPPGQSVAFDNALRSEPLHQQLWLLEGCMQISLGEQHWQLEQGDCLAMALNQTIVFANTSRKPARYLLALTALPERVAPVNFSRSIG
ncbi:helix-turn-helix domain-containing protein [Comamonas sp. J-3]|uniref:helix-turn-helix domain-containing protein n=1 Tax=Comamonas trifloxystrobinivorans TaxID=3350256 RepID=UPI00372C4F06